MHLDDLRCMLNFNAIVIFKTRFSESRYERGFVTDEHEGQRGMTFERARSSGHGHLRTEVSAHGV